MGVSISNIKKTSDTTYSVALGVYEGSVKVNVSETSIAAQRVTVKNIALTAGYTTVVPIEKGPQGFILITPVSALGPMAGAQVPRMGNLWTE
jgi:hypothetical protein